MLTVLAPIAVGVGLTGAGLGVVMVMWAVPLDEELEPRLRPLFCVAAALMTLGLCGVLASGIVWLVRRLAG